MQFKSACIFIVAFLIMVTGCTKGVNVTTPDPLNYQAQAAGHQIWGAYDIIWDGVSDTLDFVQNRSASVHFNVTPFFVPDHVSMVLIDVDPANKIFTVKITIDNPFPVNGYDVRGIANNLGSGELLNPDDYTKLFDEGTPPEVNPFRSYAKDDAHRILYSKFSIPEMHIKSETFVLHLPGAITATLLLDASWPSNCDEPYEIQNIDTDGEIIGLDGEIIVTCEVLDWQNVTASDVVIEENPVTGSEVYMAKISDTKWQAAITNAGGAPPGDYDLWIAAWDGNAPDALYNKFNVTVQGVSTWSDPILVSGEPGVNEILPRIVQRNGEVWIIYADETSALARTSFDGGMTWSDPTVIGTYDDIDTLHAVEGQDLGIYVQYQRSDYKTTYVTAYQDGVWQLPIINNIMGMTTPPYSCDLGISNNGYLFDMWTGSWSMFGFHSNNPYDLSSWTFDNIEPMYNCVYSINDGFVQNAEPKIFYIHDETTLEYGSWDWTVWNRGACLSGTDKLIEPAVAPESDDPYHVVMAIQRETIYELHYMQFATWPPTVVLDVVLEDTLTTEPVFHSVSVEGSQVSIFYDADGEVRYVESGDGGMTFSTPEVLGGGGGGGGGCKYSHVRQDPYGPDTVVAYAKEEGGDYNIYVRIK